MHCITHLRRYLKTILFLTTVNHSKVLIYAAYTDEIETLKSQNASRLTISCILSSIPIIAVAGEGGGKSGVGGWVYPVGVRGSCASDFLATKSK